MKIVIVSDFIDPEEWGGAGKVAAEQAKSLCEIGEYVTVIAPSFSCTSLPNVEHICWLFKKGLPGIWNFRNFLKTTIKRIEPDLAILHQPFSGALFQFMFPEIPSRYFFHSSWVDEMISLKNLKGIKLKAYLEKYVLSHSKKVFITSPFTLSVLKNHAPGVADAAIENPLGVRSPPFTPTEENVKEAIVKTFDIPKNHKIISLFRRLIPRTGVDLFLRVFSKCEDMTVLIGGLGAMKEALQKQTRHEGTSQNVRFLDYVEENKMVKILQASDLAVVPSLELEGFGLSTVEAMACGCPVVATPIGNNANLINSCNGGIVANSTKESDLLEAIKKCLEISWDRPSLSRTVVERYNWNRHSKKLID